MGAGTQAPGTHDPRPLDPGTWDLDLGPWALGPDAKKWTKADERRKNPVSAVANCG